MGKSFYTFIIVPNASSRLHKLKLPVRALYLLAGVGILSFFVAVSLGFSYAKMAFKAADYDKLQAENTNLKIQKKNLEVATQKLGDKINNLENISQKIQKLIENDNLTNRGKVNVPAVGGSKVDYPTAELLGGSRGQLGIDFLKGQTVRVEDRLSVLQDAVSKIRARPSIWPVKGPITSHYG